MSIFQNGDHVVVVKGPYRGRKGVIAGTEETAGGVMSAVVQMNGRGERITFALGLLKKVNVLERSGR